MRHYTPYFFLVPEIARANKEPAVRAILANPTGVVRFSHGVVSRSFDCTQTLLANCTHPCSRVDDMAIIPSAATKPASNKPKTNLVFNSFLCTFPLNEFG